MTRNCIKTAALCSSALVALAYGSSASAQAAAAAEGAAAEEVVVTGSRVITNGFAAPTPVTVITQEQMQLTAPNSLMDALNQLPQFKSSFLAQSTGFLTGGGTAGNFVNLRGLGITRNLVLLDGQRVVQQGANSTSAGAVDLNSFPQNLVKRVDVTTGGGSAQYGSDALSGVINFVLDTKFTGIKGEFRASSSGYGDNQGQTFSIAGGHSFAGGRGHVIASVEYVHGGGIKDYTDRRWADKATGVVTNVSCPTPQTSTNCPTRIVADNVMPSNAASGGLILTGATALRGQYFSGSQAILNRFPYGSNLTYAAGSPTPVQATMVGGGLPQDQNLGRFFSALPPQNRGASYVRVGWDLTPDWNVSASGMYTESHANYVGILANDSPLVIAGFTIFDDNVYLPASVRALMTTGNAGATSLNLVNPATGTLTGPTKNTFVIGRLATDWPLSQNYAETTMLRFVAGLNGKFNLLGKQWSLDAYYAHARALRVTGTNEQPYLVNLFEAIDAVASPGTAGLPPAGTPICRSTITKPNNACVPLNVLGVNPPTPAQWSWITGGQANGNSHLMQVSKEDVAEANFHGDLFPTWAGMITAGFGGSYRKEYTIGVADAISESYIPAIPGQTGFIAGTTPVLSINGIPAANRGSRGGWTQVNSGSDVGELDVKEIYGEALVPLAKDMFLAKQLDLNGAVRYADYQYGGGQTNWKVGMVWQPIEDLRVRVAESHDIRAPNLANLFAGIGASNAAVQDPFRRGTNGVIESNPSAITFSKGNPLLKPEIGDTFTMGAVYRPTWNEWVQGLSISVDYYSIIVSNAIGNAAAVTQCFNGNTYYCQFITRQSDPSTFGAGNTIGPITQVFNVPQNVGTTKNNGVDIEVAYRLPLARLKFLGEDRKDVLTMRVLMNAVTKNQQFTLGGISQTNAIGTIGGGAVTGTGGNSDWQGSLNFNYQNGPLTVNVQERFINKGRLNANVDFDGNPYATTLFTNPNTTGNGSVPNTVPAYFYTDLTINYKFGKDDRYEGFLTINNLFDKDPPPILSNYFFYGAYPTNITLYDPIGRNFTGGIRFKF